MLDPGERLAEHIIAPGPTRSVAVRLIGEMGPPESAGVFVALAQVWCTFARQQGKRLDQAAGDPQERALSLAVTVVQYVWANDRDGVTVALRQATAADRMVAAGYLGRVALALREGRYFF